MATFYPVGGGAPGIDPTALTALAGDVVSGAIAGVKDNYDPVVGTLTLTGNAQLNHVLSGETFYTTNPKSKLTGTMSVQSILSFSCAPYSTDQIIFTWQNPSVGPFSGVIIVGKTGGYPANINDGTRYYKGFGNNTSGGGTSKTIINGFSINITYYFRAFSYCTINNEEWISDTTRISNTIIQQTTLTFTYNSTWSIPLGVKLIDIFCVGGGGAGQYGENLIQVYGADGGGGGYTTTALNIPVNNGDLLNIIIGSGSNGVFAEGRGGTTIVTKNGMTLCQADGGFDGSAGGSGGGHGAWINPGGEEGSRGGNGGSDGSNGYFSTGENPSNTAGAGQGYTTRAFGEANGTLYAGGGGGGAGGANALAGTGGLGGGGNGAQYNGYPTDGMANTGGGGGGGLTGFYNPTQRHGGNGGSGICIIRYFG